MAKKVWPSVPTKTMPPRTAGEEPVGESILTAPRLLPWVRSITCECPSQPATKPSFADHGGETANLILALILPDELSRGGLQAVKVTILRAEQHAIAVEVGAGVDLGVGLKGPQLLARGGFQAIEKAVAIADVDPTAAHGRRGDESQRRGELPTLRAVLQIQRIELAVGAADVHRAIDDGGRRFETAVGGRESPEQVRLLGQVAVGDARGLCIAAKQRP